MVLVLIYKIKLTWEQRKLGDTNTYFTDGNYGEAYPKPTDMTDSNEGVPFLTGGNLKDGRLDITDASYITKEKHEKLTSGHLIEDDIVIAVRGSLGALGYVNIGNSGWNINSQLAILRTDKTELSGKYLLQFLLSGNGQIELIKRQTGSALKQLPINAIKDVNIPITSIEEQNKIGEYFNSLDHLITLHQRKYEKLVNVKKSMLDKMFPKNAEKVPEIRFKGFNDDWEQRKVGELLIERNEQAPMNEEYPLMAFIANEGVAPKGERYDRSSLVTDTENKLYKRTEFGDFIYSSNNLETGSIGLNKYGKACISPVYSVFHPTGIADSNFLGRRLVRKDFINSMVKWRQGVIYGQWRIHESDFLKIDIPVPSVEEQRQIGTFLDYLDNLITLHQRELEKLQNLKKSLLNSMFI